MSAASVCTAAATRPACRLAQTPKNSIRKSINRVRRTHFRAARTELEAADERYMRLALDQAQSAFDADEVPIGAVLVCGSEVVSSGQNMTESRRNPLCHAEMLCIMSAAERLRAWRLQDATLYCTVEPCPMCAGAILQARLKRLVYGARQPRLGADGSWVALFPEQQQDGYQGPTPEQDESETTTEPSHPVKSLLTAAATADCIKPKGSHPFHTTIAVTRGVLQEECSSIMVTFFKRRRQQQQQAKTAVANVSKDNERSGYTETSESTESGTKSERGGVD